MLVSDVIKTALAFLDRQDAADMITSDTYSSDAEVSRLVTALLHCFNAVEDELARGFFPLSKEEELTSAHGQLYYTSFSKTPYKILSVTCAGRAASYKIYPEYIELDSGKYTVAYLFAPEKKSLSNESDFPGYPIGERMLSYGIAAEYCLISGDIEASESWESRYRAEIERFRPRERTKGIKARYWV